MVDENGVILYHENLESNLNGFWVEAKDLREGDVFIGANGELSTLESIERVEFEENIKVYNFTVEDNHNYFVLATDEYGQTSVLVHNAEYGDGSQRPSRFWFDPRIITDAIWDFYVTNPDAAFAGARERAKDMAQIADLSDNRTLQAGIPLPEHGTRVITNIADYGVTVTAISAGMATPKVTGAVKVTPTVAKVLESRKGSIKQAPLPAGAPSWNEIMSMTMDEIEASAKANKAGFKEFKKLLNDKRFAK